MKDLELYIHIPFCVRKCRYCDFLSAPAPESARQAYVEQLLKEIRVSGMRCRDDQVISVFVGGGTPSVLSARQMKCLMEELKSSFHILPDAEVTVECNPGTLDAVKLRVYLEAGVNRLSIGLQSADAQELRLLGRIHTFAQFVENYELAREIGFKNINVDLMSALPGQKTHVYEKSLMQVLELRPEHISAYSLIIEEGTPFFDCYGQAETLREKGREQHLLPTEEEERRMYGLTKELLNSAGYRRYEISNYALEGFACRHNTGYWQRKNYLGLGLGAASLMENVRFSNTKSIEEYLKVNFIKSDSAVVERTELNVSEQMEEFMFLGLRMMCGVSAEEFKRKFSKTIEQVYGRVLDKQLKDGFIKKTQDGYCLTDYGIDVSNYVMSEYLFD